MDIIEKIQQQAASADASEVGAKQEILFSVIEFLVEKMNALGLSKKAVARKIRMKPSQLSRIFAAEENVTASTIGRIYWAFRERPYISHRTYATCVEDITGESSTKGGVTTEFQVTVGV